MRRASLSLALAAVAGAARAQDSYPPADAREAARQAASAVAIANAAMAKIPVPSDGLPPSEMVGGAPGSAPTFRRADAAAPRITRAAIVTTDGAGGWAVAWKAPLAATPVVLPIPVASSAQPIVCMPVSVSSTGASGRCWYARTLPAAIVSLSTLVSYDVFGAAAGAIAVQVLAIPPTQ